MQFRAKVKRMGVDFTPAAPYRASGPEVCRFRMHSVRFLSEIVLYCRCGPSPIPLSRKGGGIVETFIAFIQSVGAQVVAYFLCKWLNGLFSKGSKH